MSCIFYDYHGCIICICRLVYFLHINSREETPEFFANINVFALQSLCNKIRNPIGSTGNLWIAYFSPHFSLQMQETFFLNQQSTCCRIHLHLKHSSIESIIQWAPQRARPTACRIQRRIHARLNGRRRRAAKSQVPRNQSNFTGARVPALSFRRIGPSCSLPDRGAPGPRTQVSRAHALLAGRVNGPLAMPRPEPGPLSFFRRLFGGPRRAPIPPDALVPSLFWSRRLRFVHDTSACGADGSSPRIRNAGRVCLVRQRGTKEPIKWDLPIFLLIDAIARWMFYICGRCTAKTVFWNRE